MKEDIFGDIVLDREEAYVAKEHDCWTFCSREDTKRGIKLEFGNMIAGFRIEAGGKLFTCSEALYLCGQFSLRGAEYEAVREALRSSAGGMRAKKGVKNKHKDMIREDFDQFSTQWMLWVVWQKTVQNPQFRDLLLSLPKDALIIEDSSFQTSSTAKLWGTKNMELKRARTALGKRLEAERRSEFRTNKAFEAFVRDEQCKIEGVGVFEGKNNMGKTLMMCKRALEHDTVPPIDRDLLRRSAIYLSNDAPLQFAE